FMGSTAQRPERARELVDTLRDGVSGIPGLIPIISQSRLFELGLSGRRTSEVELVGPSLDQLVMIGARVFGDVMRIIPGCQARPIPSLDLSNPEVQVIPDRKRMAELGITARQLGLTVDAAVDGVKASEFKLYGKTIDLVLRGQNDKV